MYVLFEEGSNMACGVSNAIKPFTSGIYVDSVVGLEKKIKRTYWIEEKDSKGNPWYVDKNGVLTNNSKNAKPLTKNIEVNETIDIIHDPSCFSKIDVMTFKKEVMLSTIKYTDGMLFEFNMSDFVDLNNSENIDVGKHDIKIRPEGIAKTNEIKIKGAKEFSVFYDSDSELMTYYSFDGKMYYKCKKSIKNDADSEIVYVGFKNSKDEDAILTAYQVLFK
jgi:hypothetical protein